MRPIAAILLLVMLAGCKGVPTTQTKGGMITASRDGVTVTIEQPSNPEESATLEITTPSGDIIRAGTGSSRKDEGAALLGKLQQYRVFTYVGAGVCVLGIGLTVASFWVPLIPKMAGPLVFGGGALTAYLSTAIPEYGPYALFLSVLGAVAWFYHQTAAKKDPQQFVKKKA